MEESKCPYEKASEGKGHVQPSDRLHNTPAEGCKFYLESMLQTTSQLCPNCVPQHPGMPPNPAKDTAENSTQYYWGWASSSLPSSSPQPKVSYCGNHSEWPVIQGSHESKMFGKHRHRLWRSLQAPPTWNECKIWNVRCSYHIPEWQLSNLCLNKFLELCFRCCHQLSVVTSGC